MGIYLTNLKPDTKDDRDYIFTGAIGNLPPSVDLRPFAGNVDNQLMLSSCTANAGTSALEILDKKMTGNYEDMSRLFLYFNEREEYSELKGKDAGAYMRDICKSLYQYGVCKESEWPYNEAKVNDKPTQQCYDSALNNKVTKYERIDMSGVTFAYVKAALARGYPVICGMYLKEAFLHLKGPLDTHQYQFNTSKYLTEGLIIGSHAMLIVGYDDAKGYWIIENSWGSGWGDGGYWACPYGAMFDAHTHDLWVITGYKNYKFDENGYQAPPDVPFEINFPREITFEQKYAGEKITYSDPYFLDITSGNPPYRHQGTMGMTYGNGRFNVTPSYNGKALVFSYEWMDSDSGDVSGDYIFNVKDTGADTGIKGAVAKLIVKKFVQVAPPAPPVIGPVGPNDVQPVQPVIGPTDPVQPTPPVIGPTDPVKPEPIIDPVKPEPQQDKQKNNTAIIVIAIAIVALLLIFFK